MDTGNQVIVKRLPERLDLRQVPQFLSEMDAQLSIYKPQLVLDGAAVRQIDSAGIETLLRCMEKAMKQDGDVKLAALSPEATVILRLTRADRVFEIFDTVSEAVTSFVGFPVEDAVPFPEAPTFELRDTSDLDLAG
jgi:anti-sigma B factor antagonist